MSKWQYDLLFCMFVIGAVFLMIAKPVLGWEIEPTALTGYGALTTYVLTQRGQWTKNKNDKNTTSKPQTQADDPGEPSAKTNDEVGS